MILTFLLIMEIPFLSPPWLLRDNLGGKMCGVSEGDSGRPDLFAEDVLLRARSRVDLTVAARLRQIRLSRHVSLNQLSGDTGVDEGNLSRLERGKRVLTFDVAKRLCAYYKITLDELVGFDHGREE
jgi:DNA-binding Xre family transcriptional regulator